MDYAKSSHGWWVRYHYVDKKPKFQKLFKDKDYSSKDIAYKEAVIYLKHLKEKYPHEEKPFGKRVKNYRKPAKQKPKGYQPMGGVSRTKHPNGDYWGATISHEKYKQRMKTFSVNKFGEKEAERLAIITRILMLHSHPVKECRPFCAKF